MGTYELKQVIADYAGGKITADMAVGHGLQHIDRLYEGQAAANAGRQELRDQVKRLEESLKTLQERIDRWQKGQAKMNRPQTLENNLAALNLTVYKMKDDVDQLKARLPNDDKGDTSVKN